MQNYHLGCPIWSNKDWVGEFFSADAKQKNFLPQYASVFNTVEGNTTFYGLPTEKTLARWLDETPEGFKFALKFPRAISHDKRLKNVDAETDAFLNVLDTLKDRVGPSFLQLPPYFGPDDLPLLNDYLGALPYNFPYAVEIRHPAFFSGSEAALNDILIAPSFIMPCPPCRYKADIITTPSMYNNDLSPFEHPNSQFSYFIKAL